MSRDGCSGCTHVASCTIDAASIGRSILLNEVGSSLGCTELGAIALAAAHARSHVDGRVTRIKGSASHEVFLNGSSAGIPGTGGKKGIALTYALGVVVGNPANGMQVLEGIDAESLRVAEGMVDDGIITCDPANRNDIFVSAEVETAGGTCEVIVQGNHSNIAYCSVCKNSAGDRQKALNHEAPSEPMYHDELRALTFQDLVLMASQLPSDCTGYIQDGIEQNRNAASNPENSHLERFDFGKLVKLHQEQGIIDGLVARIAEVTTSATSHRMMGGVCPIMSSGGSGNQGVIAIVVPSMIGEFIDADQSRIQQGVYLSHLINAKIKAHVGLTSAQCGCGIAAGVGAAVGAVYIMGGNFHQMMIAFNYTISALAGMVCDGANLACATKVDVSTYTAVRAAFAAVQNSVQIDLAGGVISDDPIQTIKNLARVSLEMNTLKDQIIKGS